MVVLYHATLLENASRPDVMNGLASGLGAEILRVASTLKLGVALFFVISGYCIAAAADSARRRPRGVREYCVRRFRRIYPPLWAVILASVLFFLLVDYWPLSGLLSQPPWAQPRPFWYSMSQWIGNLTLTETWRHHVWGDPRGHFPGQAWTLCYEEQFYFVTGLLAWLQPQRFFRGMCGVTALTMAAMLIGRRLGVDTSGFFFDGSWLLFAAGVGVYYRLVHATARQAPLIDLALVAAIPASRYLLVPIEGATVAFVFAAALPWLYRVDRRVSRSAWLRPLAVCGQMCYSLYLVHQLPVKAVSEFLRRLGVTGEWPTLLVTVPACLAVSLGLGWLFHVAIERRFLNRPIDCAPASMKVAGVLARPAI